MRLTSFLLPKRNYSESLLKLHGKKYLQLPNNDKRKMQFEALTTGVFNSTYTDLHIAARAGQADVVDKLIAKLSPQQQQPMLNSKSSSGVTPLLLATQAMMAFEDISEVTDYPNVIRILLNAGADPNIEDRQMGATALHYAVQFSNQEPTKILVEYSAKINIPDYDSNTPLHLAIMSNHFQSKAIAKFLIQKLRENRIDPNSKNIHNQTPLDLAMAMEQWDLAIKLHGSPLKRRPKHMLS